MLCYRDRTFCISAYCTNKCGRQLTRKDRIAAAEMELPIGGSIFCGKEGEVITITNVDDFIDLGDTNEGK